MRKLLTFQIVSARRLFQVGLGRRNNATHVWTTCRANNMSWDDRAAFWADWELFSYHAIVSATLTWTWIWVLAFWNGHFSYLINLILNKCSCELFFEFEILTLIFGSLNAQPPSKPQFLMFFTVKVSLSLSERVVFQWRAWESPISTDSWVGFYSRRSGWPTFIGCVSSV